MSRQPATVLAFDYGQRRIGVAVGQAITGTARPLVTVAVRGRQGPDWPAVTELLEEWCPEALLVGLPLDMDGSEQEMTRRSRRFARQLEHRYRLPVHLVDERFTTREANARLAERGERGADDPVAAQLILEDWLGAGGGR